MRVPLGLMLGIMGGLVIFGRLGCPLLEPEEARYAEIPRQMLAEGRFIVPHWQGQPYLHKPPLLYWLVMGCYQLFGVNDVAARLVPCLAAWLTLMAVYSWTSRQAGPRTAAWTGFLLCLTAGFLYRAPMLSMDSLLTLFVVAGLWWAHEALTPLSPGRPAAGCWISSAICCGLGILTKGPVAVVLIVVPIILYRLMLPHRRTACGNVAGKSWLIYFCLSASVALPWYLAVAWREPAAVWDFIWLHNAQRFMAPFDHAEPFWYYAPVLVVALLPGSLLMPWLAIRLWRQAKFTPSASLLAGLGGMCCVLFFSLSGCKRAGYILPALPLLVMVIGLHSQAWLRRTLAGMPASAVLAVPAGVAMLVVFQVLPAYHERFSMRSEVCGHRQAAAQPDVQVACYPRGWDSVPFYLDREVEVYTRERRLRLVEWLRSSRPMVLFVKAAHLDEVRPLLGALPGHQVKWSPGRNVAVVVRMPADTHVGDAHALAAAP